MYSGNESEHQFMKGRDVSICKVQFKNSEYSPFSSLSLCQRNNFLVAETKLRRMSSTKMVTGHDPKYVHPLSIMKTSLLKSIMPF
jgi:hypothetical protein